DAARLDRAHLLDDAKEAVQLLEHSRLLVGAEIETRELGDATHVGRGQGHREIRDAKRRLIRAKGLRRDRNRESLGLLSPVNSRPSSPLRRARRHPIPSSVEALRDALTTPQ